MLFWIGIDLKRFVEVWVAFLEQNEAYSRFLLHFRGDSYEEAAAVHLIFAIQTSRIDPHNMKDRSPRNKSNKDRSLSIQ